MSLSRRCYIPFIWKSILPHGGHWPRKGVWGCAALKTPFSCLSCMFTRVPFQAKESVHKTPFWENLEILASTAQIFAQILAHKPPKFGNFQFTSPLNLEFSVHKPPLSEASISSQAPHFENPGRTALPEKSWVPPPPGILLAQKGYLLFLCVNWMQHYIFMTKTRSWLFY